MWGLLRILAVVGAAGCAKRTCGAAREPRADDVPVSGASLAALVAALEAQPFADVPLVWRDGQATTATGRIEVVRGSARRVQRPDCLPECGTRYHLAMACSPDSLAVEARGTATTADGRVDVAWSGHVLATALDGPIEWRLSPEPVPLSRVAGTLDAVSLAEARDPLAPGLRVHLGGVDGELRSVGFDLAWRTDGEGGSIVVSSLGHTPIDDGTRPLGPVDGSRAAPELLRSRSEGADGAGP